MSGDPQIDAEIKKITALSIWSQGKLLNTPPDQVFLAGLKPATREMILQDEEVNKANSDFQAFVAEVLNLTSSTLHDVRYYSTPFRTLGDWPEKLKEFAISQINALVEETDINIERITEAITMLTASISPETKHRILNHPGESINFRRGGQSWGSIKIYGENNWEKYETETREKLQILQLGISFHEKSKTIFQQAIKNREAKKHEITKRIHAARKLCDEAEKVIEKIRKAEQPFRDGNFGDIKAAKEFVHGWQRLEQLRTEFSTLRGSGIEFLDFGHPEPIFPSTAGLIALEGDAERKGKIFQIFEKQEK